jgi:uncharacterized protein
MSISYLYLHGWASSPDSHKARFFREKFAEKNLICHAPDLNQADFYHLTLSRQIKQAAEYLNPNTENTVIGSSLGGLTALWLAAQYPAVTRLILLAPALQFFSRCQQLIGAEQMRIWQEKGELPIYHYAYERLERLSYEFITDMANYGDDELTRVIPTLILHGIQDEVVPIAHSQAFAATRPWVQCRALDSDHGLNNVHEELWEKITAFCELEPIPKLTY